MKAKLKVLPNGSVTSPAGFTASGMHAGIKTASRKNDVMLIVSKQPAVAAGAFTTNQVKAWPLRHDLRILNNRNHRVIFANSGNANCFNGLQGNRAAERTLWILSRALKIEKNRIFLASTGIIGRPLPIEKIENAIPALVRTLSKEGGHEAARGILTTDTTTKEIAVQFIVDGKPVTLAACAKGAGMVNPEMNRSGLKTPKHATMLCFVTTDLNISKRLFQKIVSSAVKKTFNRLVIDNDQSTNDMALALANGLSGNKKITSEDSAYRQTEEAMTYVFEYIARNLAKDGEGVTHMCEIRICGAQSPWDAERAGRQIASSMLFKTMLAGEDPNWGRLMGCVGASGARFSPRLDISFDGVAILKNGSEIKKNRTAVRQILKKKEFSLEINLKKGRFADRFWATDLTKFYVWINARYST